MTSGTENTPAARVPQDASAPQAALTRNIDLVVRDADGNVCARTSLFLSFEPGTAETAQVLSGNAQESKPSFWRQQEGGAA